MRRRTFLRAVGAGGVAGLAGCAGGGGDSDGGGSTDASTSEADTATATATGTTASGTPELVVSTYGAFVDAPSTSPGPWIKETFESEFDATLEFATPDSEINYYIERAGRNVDIDADVYVGLNVDMLIRMDERLDDELFTTIDDVAGQDDVKERLYFDPRDRIVPFDTSYVSIVYNETFDDGEFVAPETFDELLEPEYAGDLLTQNPAASATGKSFLLHTIIEKGPEGYLDYWEELQANDVRVLSDWSTSYSAYDEDEEAPMVVSYSTDQVYANRYDQDMAKHQIRFLNDQGYEYPEGMAIFEGSDNPELAREFLGFMLRPDVQGEIAQRNVAFPATETAEIPSEFDEYAHAPPEPVSFTYDELRENVSEWTEAWERQFASK